jgi:hypothetical protein
VLDAEKLFRALHGEALDLIDIALTLVVASDSIDGLSRSFVSQARSCEKMPMRKIALIVIALGIAGLCSACATLLFRGSTEEISVNSDPPGATTTLDDGETEVTPFSITVQRHDDVHFHFSKPGYKSVEVSDDAEPQTQYLFLDLLIPIPPLAPFIDTGTGAIFEHRRSQVFAHLDPKQPTAGTVGGSTAAQSLTNPDPVKGN